MTNDTKSISFNQEAHRKGKGGQIIEKTITRARADAQLQFNRSQNLDLEAKKLNPLVVVFECFTAATTVQRALLGETRALLINGERTILQYGPSPTQTTFRFGPVTLDLRTASVCYFNGRCLEEYPGGCVGRLQCLAGRFQVFARLETAVEVGLPSGIGNVVPARSNGLLAFLALTRIGRQPVSLVVPRNTNGHSQLLTVVPIVADAISRPYEEGEHAA